MNVIDIPWISLTYIIIFLIISLSISFIESLRLEKSILLGTFRAISQLIITGYLIRLIFEVQKWYIILFVILVMLILASQILAHQVKGNVKGLYYSAFIAISLASVLSLVLMSVLIIQQNPWYNARYIIPIGGMVIANGMNGAILAGERYKNEIFHRLSEVEMFLSLGYDSKKASHKVRQKALTAAMLPPINNLMAMGLVALPGMMTGQIIAGSDPVTAIKYQIVIVITLLATVAVTSWIFVRLLDKKYFTQHHQIRYNIIK